MYNKKIGNVMLRAICCVFVLVLTVNFSGCAKKYGALGQAGDEAPLHAGLRMGTLSNGLSYYILENKKPENRAYLSLVVNAGSLLEDENQRGLAHFVEHMAFEGTTNFPKNKLEEYLLSLGMDFGPDFNAHTGYDYTQYDIMVPTTPSKSDAYNAVKTIPDDALRIIDDWTHEVLFDEDEVNDERSIIMEEYRMRLGVRERLRDTLFPVLFKGSRYVERKPIGLPEVIENAPTELLKDFYQKWYRADNMALVFIGDFDADTLERELESRFTIPPPHTPTVIPVYELPPPEKNIEAKIFIDSEQSSPYAYIYYKQQFHGQDNTLKFIRGIMTNLLIDEIISERFSDAEQLPDTPYFSASAGELRYVRNSLHYFIGAASKTGLMKESLEALLSQKESIERYGFTKGEMERAKANLMSVLTKAAAEKDKVESETFRDYFAENFLENTALTDSEWDLKAAQEMLPSINLRELQSTAKNYFTEDVLVFISANEADAASLPSEEEIVSIVANANKLKVAKPKKDTVSKKLIKAPPSPGSVVSEAIDNETKTTIWYLSNGAKVLLKPTTNKNDQILLYSAAQGGTGSVSAIEDIISAELAGELMNASGLGKWNLSALNKMLAGKQVSVSFDASTYTRSVNGATTTRDIQTLFELLYLTFTEPRFDAEQARIMQDQYRTILARRADNSDEYFGDEITRILYNNNPYFKPTEVSDIDSFNIEAARSFAELCLNPADYTFVFVGNIDLYTMRPLIEQYLAAIPQKEVSLNTYPNIVIDYPSVVDKSVYKGREDKSAVYLTHILKREYDFTDNMTADVLSSYLEILFNDVVRQKKGLVYGIYSGISFSYHPEMATLSSSVYFDCDPKNIAEITVSVEAELAKIASGSINQKMFNDAKESLYKNLETSLQNNSYIGSRFANYSALLNIPLSTLYNKGEYYNKTSQADISALAREVLGSGLVRIALYPEKE